MLCLMITHNKIKVCFLYKLKIFLKIKLDYVTLFNNSNEDKGIFLI